MSRVYVIQAPAIRQRGDWVEKYDLSPAEQFGELVRVLPYGNVPEDPRPTLARLRQVLSGYDFELDAVLLLGDPVAIAQAVAVLCSLREGTPHPIRALKWDRRLGRYAPYLIG